MVQRESERGKSNKKKNEEEKEFGGKTRSIPIGQEQANSSNFYGLCSSRRNWFGRKQDSQGPQNQKGGEKMEARAKGKSDPARQGHTTNERHRMRGSSRSRGGGAQ